MSIAHIRTIAALELKQRMRSVGWYVLLGIYAALLIGVTALAFLVYSWGDFIGAGVYSIVVFFVLLLVVLVSPTLSGSAINGDRDAATLAAVQVTAASTGDIMLGKLLAAVATGAAFLVVAVPFLALSLIGGGTSILVLLVSLGILAAEIIVVAAIGVGLSGLIARPLFSVAATYLVVAGLTIGTLIAFVLVGMSIRTETTTYSRPYDTSGDVVCDDWETYTSETPRFDLAWGILALNPFVVLADATPVSFSDDGYPIDMFGQITYGVRMAQQTPGDQYWDDYSCPGYEDTVQKTPQEMIEGSVPSWFVGLGLQIVLAAGIFAGAWARTRTPARKLPPGTRIA